MNRCRLAFQYLLLVGFKVHCYRCCGGEWDDGNDGNDGNDSESDAEGVGGQEGFIYDNYTTYY